MISAAESKRPARVDYLDLERLERPLDGLLDVLRGLTAGSS
jgi:hypothetical protein